MEPFWLPLRGKAHDWVRAISAAVLPALLITHVAGKTHHSSIDRIGHEEAQSFLVEQSGCEGDHPLTVYKFEHANLTRDGRDNLIVVASTCNTGTAGPDVHSILSRNEAGELVELPIEKPKMPRRRVLFGNSNSNEDAQGGELVSTYQDTSDRAAPLVIRYKWNGKEFRQISLVAAKPYPASFNCEQAQEEVEQAICASKKVAKLDRDLNAVYLARIRSVPPDQREKLREEQRAWIAKRNNDCVVYKWWVDCLTDMYTKRIDALKRAEP